MSVYVDILAGGWTGAPAYCLRCDEPADRTVMICVSLPGRPIDPNPVTAPSCSAHAIDVADWAREFMACH